jgi:two-component system, OmpR family, sensor kinase
MTRRSGTLGRSMRSLRVRVLATAMAVFAISLAVTSFLAYELLLTDGRRDADVILAREQERFERSMGELLPEAQEDAPDRDLVASLRAAVRRYLQLNPSTSAYWTIVTFEDGQRLAAANGPPELEPLFHGEDGQTLPEGELNAVKTASTTAGDVRILSVPILLEDEPAATLQILAPLDPVRSEAISAAMRVAAAAGLALIVGGVLLGLSLWRSLAPLGALASAARSTELRSLGTRVDEPETNDEVGLLAREFNTMLARLEAASVQQREFMASIGHELRTPITIVRGHLEVLQAIDRDDTAFPETVAILEDELGHMSRLVEDLMAIARAEMDDLVRPREVELVQWFEDLELRLDATDAGRDVTVVPPPPVDVAIDPDRMAQAALNLVINAHVHTPAGTPVRVSAALEAGRVVISVSDDGPGIPEEIRDEVFTPFVRAGDAPGSTGLGLAVVKAVAEAHGGEVRLSTGPGGTRFDLVVPWDGDDEVADLDPDDAVGSGPGDQPTEVLPASGSVG